MQENKTDTKQNLVSFSPCIFVLLRFGTIYHTNTANTLGECFLTFPRNPLAIRSTFYAKTDEKLFKTVT